MASMTNHNRGAGRGVLAAALLLGLAQNGSFATEAEPELPAGTADPAAAVGELRGTQAASPVDRQRAREAELEAIRRSIEVSERRQNALRDEMAGLENDRAKLSADLIATAQRLRQAENEIADIEKRLAEMHAAEDAVRLSLRERRAVMSEVLMALQRMGRTPPPAILSRPEDALAAIRGSILAGAVLPDIRIEAEALAVDLTQLTELTQSIEREHEALRGRYASLGEEQARINLLVSTKRQQGEQTEAALSAEQSKAGELANQAQNLQALIKSLEAEIGSAAAAAAQAKAAATVEQPADQAEAERRLSDTNRIAPAVKFANAKGLLTWPVSGQKIRGFGEPDELGEDSQGISLAARPKVRSSRRPTAGLFTPDPSVRTARC
jgi:septal ring factor EnvC (AmiA/AmiB activator)